MMVITMLAALVGDLFLLPALIQRVELVTAWDLLKLIPTLGAMPPGLVHELNQPLNAIKVGSQFLKRMAREDATVQKEQLGMVARQISSQVDRTAAIINRLSEFTPNPERITEKVDLNRPARRIEPIIQGQLQAEGIKLQLELADHLPPIVADHNRLVQVLFNVLTNAAEAIVEKKAAYAETDTRRITLRTYHEKNKVTLSISDNGAGMSTHVRKRMFQPFFTTKSPGKGIGLTISNEIIRDFDGSIDVESREGEGTTFTIRFPIAAEEANGGAQAPSVK
jgi:C4-dicarboxylate-specific signal transduction histidine kinase